MPPHTSVLRRLRAFTLIELIVVILILGILAAVAVLGYAEITNRANAARANTNLRQIATAVLAHATQTQAAELSRPLVEAAIEEGAGVTVEPLVSAATTWYLGGADDVPRTDTEYAVAFDNGDGVVQADESGSRAVVVSAGGGHLYARVMVWGAGGLRTYEVAAPAGSSPADIVTNPALVDVPLKAGGGNTGNGNTVPPLSQTRIYSAVGYDSGAFGEHVDVDGNVMVVGAEYADSDAGQTAGAAYVFVRDKDGVWQETAKLSQPAGAPWSSFGQDVAIDGNTIAVGASKAPTIAGTGGAVYVFTTTNQRTWTLQAALAAHGATFNGLDAFSESLALDGDNLVVGAPWDDAYTTEDYFGRAYLYHRTGTAWTLTGSVAGPSTDSDFGWDVTVGQDWWAVGARASQTVHLYRTGSVTPFATLTPPGPDQAFGTSVSLDGTTLAVGSRWQPYSPPTWVGAQQAYIFVFNGTGWGPQQVIGNQAADGAQYAVSVSVQGDNLLIGVPGSGTAPARAEVFTRTDGTWTYKKTLDGTGIGNFAWGVVLDGGRAYVGAPYDDTPGMAGSNTKEGAVYLFQP